VATVKMATIYGIKNCATMKKARTIQSVAVSSHSG
jgi:arsenate reductase-like glutaredoxin family protein